MSLVPAVKKPCQACPFSKSVKSVTLGGSHTDVYIGQIHLPMWLPCHTDNKYADKSSDVNKVHQCSGASRLRKKLLKEPQMFHEDPIALQDDPDGKAFDSIQDFVKHHTGNDTAYIDWDYIDDCKLAELSKLTQTNYKPVTKES